MYHQDKINVPYDYFTKSMSKQWWQYSVMILGKTNSILFIFWYFSDVWSIPYKWCPFHACPGCFHLIMNHQQKLPTNYCWMVQICITIARVRNCPDISDFLVLFFVSATNFKWPGVGIQLSGQLKSLLIKMWKMPGGRCTWASATSSWPDTGHLHW